MSPQETIAHYRIISKLGEGGMGAVYRATDTKLNRDVAIKVLPDSFAQDSDRIARFEREAKVLAALNHPNIAQIYGVENRALVMELVEGEDLKGPLPLETALNYARQIAAALEAAHEKGIIHRDLKPANIMVTSTGVVKVLDFGLAAVAVSGSMSGDPARSPTLTIGASQAGMILGTAGYMAPEQARGRPADKRADIWAFGVVLYEMLTGRRLFEGDDVSTTLAAVIKDEPKWDGVPPNVQRLLKSCLEKDPQRRLRDIGDAWRLLDETPQLAPQPASRRSARSLLLPIVAAVGVISALAVSFIHFREQPPAVEVVRFQIAPPENRRFLSPGVNISPDGRRLAFLVGGADARSQLWVRSLDSLESRPLAGTEGALPGSIWSPDSRFLGFVAQGKLKKVDVAGGPPQTICDIPAGGAWRGGAWSRGSEILFGVLGSGLWRIADSGGAPAPVTRLDLGRQESSHSSPYFIPDGRHFLYFRFATLGENNGIYLGSLDVKPEQQSGRRLAASDTAPVHVPAGEGSTMGHLLFAREGSLMAQAFDARRMELVREAVPIAEGMGGAGNAPAFSASLTGVLAYRGGAAFSGLNTVTQLAWFDHEGKPMGAVGDPDQYGDVAFSPDGTRVTLSRNDRQATGGGPLSSDIWVHEFARGTNTRITSDPGSDYLPIWSPDGTRVIFSAVRGSSAYDLYQKDANGAGNEELLVKSEEDKVVNDRSRDGKFLLYSVTAKGRARIRSSTYDMWWLPLAGSNAGERKPEPYLKTEFSESQGQFSPDGRYVAYRSDASGTDEIYVQPFPAAGGGKWTISKGGGLSPRWRGDGRELYYISPDAKMMAVEVNPNPVFKAGIPRALFQTAILETSGAPSRSVFRYDVTADGKKFLINTMPRETGGQAADPITVVLNWTALLKK